jgi:geranylgeranyl diphosphate synthase type I
LESLATFESALKETAESVKRYLSIDAMALTTSEDLRDSLLYYPNLGGKRLRPFAVIASCGAVGGQPDKALPLAAAVELYHTGTLVLDDYIDCDERRRGGETVHLRWAKIARQQHPRWTKAFADHYGFVVAILTGELHGAWSIGGLLPLLYYEKGVRPEIVLKLIKELDFVSSQMLAGGELDDVIFSKASIRELGEDRIIDMLWRKTGSLYRFCGMSGAMVGLDTDDERHPLVLKMANFAAQCGLAFQIQDDILGVIGDEDKIGKSTGSDLRSGKPTLLLWWALRNCSSADKMKILNILEKPAESRSDVKTAVDVLKRSGAIKFAADIAQTYVRGGEVNGKRITGALEYLEGFGNVRYTELLREWARYLVNRTF